MWINRVPLFTPEELEEMQKADKKISVDFSRHPGARIRESCAITNRAGVLPYAKRKGRERK